MAATITLKKNSRLRFAQLLLLDGVTFWNLLDMPAMPTQPDDIQYQVLATDRIDTIANQFYGDPVLWWVIAAANNIEIVPTQLNAGQTLRIPSPRFVLGALFQNVLQ
jgi:hypothetical protein